MVGEKIKKEKERKGEEKKKERQRSFKCSLSLHKSLPLEWFHLREGGGGGGGGGYW